MIFFSTLTFEALFISFYAQPLIDILRYEPVPIPPTSCWLFSILQMERHKDPTQTDQHTETRCPVPATEGGSLDSESSAKHKALVSTAAILVLSGELMT